MAYVKDKLVDVEEAALLYKKLNDAISEKVDKETGKGLSTNDYTTAEKTKLAGIGDGAEANVQSDWGETNTASDAYIKNKPSVYTKTEIDTELAKKVSKETGKGLSTNDYTTAEKTKLSNIEPGAEVNVQSDWNETNTSSDAYIKNKPLVYTKAEMNTELAKKVDKETGKGLSSNDYTDEEKEKLADIEDNAEENENSFTSITIAGTKIPAISKTDTLTLAAGTNVSLQFNVANRTVAISASGGGGGGGSSVQSDWNETDTAADDYIKNKPSIYTQTQIDTKLAAKVDTETGKGLSSNDYTDDDKDKLDDIEDGAQANVQSDWNETDTAADDYIKNKPFVYTQITVGSNKVAATVLKDNVTFVAGTNIEITANTTTKTITFNSVELDEIPIDDIDALFDEEETDVREYTITTNSAGGSTLSIQTVDKSESTGTEIDQEKQEANAYGTTLSITTA